MIYKWYKCIRHVHIHIFTMSHYPFTSGIRRILTHNNIVIIFTTFLVDVDFSNIFIVFSCFGNKIANPSHRKNEFENSIEQMFDINSIIFRSNQNEYESEKFRRKSRNSYYYCIILIIVICIVKMKKKKNIVFIFQCLRFKI